uniref:Uncharacterized protein n=1 Tax=Anguilla anguilla TaxID=7936 RepID=A0A0E9QEZ0_ANGAN
MNNNSKASSVLQTRANRKLERQRDK